MLTSSKSILVSLSSPILRSVASIDVTVVKAASKSNSSVLSVKPSPAVYVVLAAAMVILSVAATVVIVTFEPSTRLRVSVADSATTLS